MMIYFFIFSGSNTSSTKERRGNRILINYIYNILTHVNQIHLFGFLHEYWGIPIVK